MWNVTEQDAIVYAKVKMIILKDRDIFIGC